MNSQLLDELARGLQNLIPKDAQRLKEDLEQNLRALVASTLERMDLVTRDELDRQTLLLERYREKLELLEQRVAELEGKAADAAKPPEPPKPPEPTAD